MVSFKEGMGSMAPRERREVEKIYLENDKIIEYYFVYYFTIFSSIYRTLDYALLPQHVSK